MSVLGARSAPFFLLHVKRLVRLIFPDSRAKSQLDSFMQRFPGGKWLKPKTTQPWISVAVGRN